MGANADTSFKKYSDKSIIIAQLFGWFGNENNAGNPSRILVRDACLTHESADLLEHSEFTDMPYSEVKFENVINRLTGTAEHSPNRTCTCWCCI
jgi:CRISPR-associated protein Csm3